MITYFKFEQVHLKKNSLDNFPRSLHPGTLIISIFPTIRFKTLNPLLRPFRKVLSPALLLKLITYIDFSRNILRKCCPLGETFNRFLLCNPSFFSNFSPRVSHPQYPLLSLCYYTLFPFTPLQLTTPSPPYHIHLLHSLSLSSPFKWTPPHESYPLSPPSL